ncbi:hypothetical protein HK100_001446 [Physocladia obscura]|uniref:Tyrosinase copper-binding domain-containing protein n=1 Tax=Physocladia obscura TaxID=109957 RepID=A0AAD5XEV4_9FUNG|nr:hypothetical protein HK100_001446 [Physocladia obscura]
MLSSFVCLVAAVALVTAQCTNPTLRREWAELSATEKSAYVAAVVAIGNRPQSFQYVDPTQMSGRDFAYTHSVVATWAHMNAEFLVYHRAMLHKYEQALSAEGWTGGLVYLDEAGYYNNWMTTTSPRDLFNSEYFGGVTTPDVETCLPDGQFSQASGFMVLDSGGVSKCLSRCGDPTSAMWSAQNIADMLAGVTNYDVTENPTGGDYQTSIDASDSSNFHAAGHIVMGSSACDVGNFYWSPRDPLFFLHHAYVDKIFWKWQNLCPSYAEEYEGNLQNGVDPYNSAGGNGQVATLDIPLDSWSGLTPRDVISTSTGILCYTYSQSAGDIAFTHPQCSDGSTPNYNPYGKVDVNASPIIVSPTPTAATAETNATATSSATTSPAIDTVSDNWVTNALILLVAQTGQGFSFTSKPAVVVERDVAPPTPTPTPTPIPVYRAATTTADPTTNITTVTVICGANTDVYTLPAGYVLHRATCTRIVVKPEGFVFDYNVGISALEEKPFVIFAKSMCDIDVEIAKEEEDAAATATATATDDGDADELPVCPRFLTDEEAQAFHLNVCLVKRGNRRLKKKCRVA